MQYGCLTFVHSCKRRYCLWHTKSSWQPIVTIRIPYSVCCFLTGRIYCPFIIGNAINRTHHAEYGALLANDLLKETDMSLEDRITVIAAIGNHDESTGSPEDVVSAALIIADKTDVRTIRLRYPWQGKLCSYRRQAENRWRQICHCTEPTDWWKNLFHVWLLWDFPWAYDALQKSCGNTWNNF